ncbi:Similar to SLC4A1AP: Kanadaptin (Homo sapiens) [Cotesia congregata]|uniref:Similar to SLC4A1AP: Kanadaptin (Homo sapiens) n=1 Tax=Cotesia congregata TaxID=51543 RepID=A0A8J2HRA5_COTCN|nr:Similar to SLC4A1AP: Kanadaptin (Homo sapiens) [Cotesia congregata]
MESSPAETNKSTEHIDKTREMEIDEPKPESDAKQVPSESAETETDNSEDVSRLSNPEPSEDTFKVPHLMSGKPSSKRKLPDPPSKAAKKPTDDSNEPEIISESIEPPKAAPQDQKHLPLPYKEPAWSGTPPEGRLPVCDIPLAHPTISRYHAILQYRAEGDDKNEPGFYLYDLESTHGSFWNSCRIRPKTFVKLKGGHMLRFGCSQRKFIVQTPPEDEEMESEYSVTELKEMRRQELMTREKEQQIQEEMERLKKEKEEAEGIDWGMGEDADEDTDLTENPFAVSNNEELFLEDPKKTLRGWFEREGFDLQYQTEEKGIGQFLCWVDLPVESGRTVRAEALVKGKKKESVIQCALEACRVLDRHGLLRQATHEGRKRKTRNWEEEDFYDSDEDNFLDRTGTVERKRERRMRSAGKLENKAENFASLSAQLSNIAKDIAEVEEKLKKHEEAKRAGNSDSNEDALDAFMSSLNTAVLSKSEVLKLKSTLQKLKKEQENFKKLVEITRPTSFPSFTSISDVKEESEERDRSEVPDDRLEDKPVESEKKKVLSRYGLIKSEDIPATEALLKLKKKTGGDEDQVEENEEECDDTAADTVTAVDLDTVGESEVKSIDVEMKKELSEAEIARRRKKNMKRNQKRAEKAAKEGNKAYDEEIHSEDYSTWVPPSNQTGDGRTSLNEKFAKFTDLLFNNI